MSVAMGLYHFWLPLMFQWGKFMAQEPATIRWGHYSINFFFSFLLVVGGVLCIVTAKRWARREILTPWVVWGMCAFWVANALYQLIIPMPLPANLRGIGIGLLSYGIIAAALHAWAGLAWRSQDTAPGRPTP